MGELIKKQVRYPYVLDPVGEMDAFVGEETSREGRAGWYRIVSGKHEQTIWA